MLPLANLIELIAGLETAEPGTGIRLMDSRFRESFHTYPEIHARVGHIAGQLQAGGVSPGDRVLLSMPTEVDAVCSFLALLWLGAVPYSVSSPLLGQDREAHRRQVVRLIRMHEINRVLRSRDLEAIAGSSPEAPASLDLSFRIPEEEDLASVSWPAPARVSAEDTAFVQFSSGSTSHPKGVRITHGNMVYNLGVIVENDGRTPRSVFVSWLPLYHDMGLVGGLFSNLVHRNLLVLMHPRCFIARPLSWLAAISKWGGTTTAVPNFALDMCTDRIREKDLEAARLDLRPFRYVYNGAEPVHVGAIRRFEEKFGPHGFEPGSVHPVYGMSEMTLIVTAPRPEEPIRTLQVEGMEVPSVGRPLGDSQVRVRDEQGHHLAPGEIGEIWVRGTSLTPGYVPPPTPEENPIQDGWLATGDLGLIDGEGRLYVTGRRKDLIIFQGRNFYGHDIAARVEEIPGAKRGKVYVFDLDRSGSTEVVVMAAPPDAGEDGSGAAEADLRRRIQQQVLQEFGLPVHDVFFTATLPKTTSGKFARHRCQRLYLEYLESRGSGQD